MMLQQFALFSTLLVWLIPSMAAARETKKPEPAPRFVPMLALGGGLAEERSELEVSEYTDTTDRAFWTLSLDVGLRYPVPSGFLPSGSLIGRSFIGAAFVFRPGDWPVRLLQEFVWDFKLRKWLGLFFGFGICANLNPTRFSRSYFNFSIPVGIRLGRLEAAFSLGYNVSISKDEKTVYDGEMTQRTATAFAPVYFYLRLHLPTVGW